MREGHCNKCKRLRWVNVTTRGGELAGEYCEDCFDSVEHDTPRKQKTATSSGPNHNDPGFDNVIRAMEEGRD